VKVTKAALLACAALTSFDYYRNVMATTAPISPRRDAKVNPEPRRIKQFEAEAPASTENQAELNPPTASENENITEPHAAVAPDHESVARLAYGYWLDRRDNGEGSAEEDWFRAEQELRNR